MHLRNVSSVTPFQADHGETVYETLGHAAGGATSHSLAQIVLAPGAASLKHFHPAAEETYHILSGAGEIEIDGVRSPVRPGDSLYIAPRAAHQIANTGADELVFLAICVPAWTPDNSVYVD